MNSLLRIQVRVNAKAANANLRALTTQLDAFAVAARAAGAAGGSIGMIGPAARSTVGPLRAQNTAIRNVNKSLAASTQLTKQHAGVVGFLNHAINGASTASSKGLLGMSKNLQWIGRQLNFNFTIPLGIAATAAMNWALDVEAAFTRVRKVYGDDPSKDYSAELDRIAYGTRLLSDYFGVAQEDVNQLAAMFAAAGAEGGALIKSVETGLRLKILGDYENIEDVFSGLITIQKAYNLTAAETAAVIDLLNAVENQTEADLPGLVEGIEKAGSMAAAAGVDFRDLALAIATMTPVAGTPEEIGTSLKTLFSRILDPTKDIEDAFKQIGIDIRQLTSDGVGALDIIEMMALAGKDLSDSVRGELGSILGGRRQANRILALWDGMIDRAEKYEEIRRLLDPENDAVNIARAQKEIDTLLASDPQRLEILKTQIKNLAIDAIQPMIPLLIGLVAMIKKAMEWFNSLDPTIQKYIATGLVAVAVTGMLAQFIGSIGLLIGTLANFALKPILLLTSALSGIGKILAPLGGMFAKLVFSPWGIALAAIVALLIIFRDDLADIFSDLWNFIARGFNKLPESIANAMRAVVDILARAAEAIANFFGGIFGVQTKSGVDVNIPKPSVGTGRSEKFHSGGVVGGSGEVPAVLQAGEMVLTAQQQATLFKIASQGIRDANKTKIRQDQIKAVDAAAPGSNSGIELNNLFAQLDSLEGALNSVGSAMEAQQAIVDGLDADYEQAKQAVEDFEKSMEPLKEQIDSLNATIDAAQSRISELASTPLEGMGAMSDAIFENQMATKKLRLELLMLGDAADSYEDIRSKISAINGDIEMLRGKMDTLRESGAGSEILGVYQQQLDALEAQKDSLKDQADEAKKIEDELASLEKAGQILELQQSITFDPLVRQIDQMANGVAEMPFDEVVSQIQQQKDIIASTTVELEKATAEYDLQTEKLEILKAHEEEIGALRDQETDKLDEMKSQYDDIKDTISEIEKLISDTVSAAEALTNATKGAAGGAGGGGGGLNLPGGDFPDPIVPDVDFGELDLEAEIKRLEDAIADAWDDWDILGPLEDKWNEVKEWWAGLDLDPNVLKAIGAGIGILAATAIGGPWGAALAGMAAVWILWGDDILATLDKIRGSKAWGFISGLFEQIGNTVKSWFMPIWNQIKTSFGEFEESAQRVKDAVAPIFESMSTTIGPVLGPLLIVVQTMYMLLGAVTGFVASQVMDSINNVFQIFVGALTTVANVINGDFDAAWKSLKTMLGDVVDLFLSPFINLGQMLKEVGKGLVNIIMQVAGDVIGGFLGGLQSAFWGVLNWFGNIPFSAMNKLKEAFGIASPSTLMAEIGVDVIAGLLLGLAEKFLEVLTWFGSLPLWILEKIGDATLTLAEKGREFIGGLMTGIKERWETAREWVVGLPGRVINAIGDVLLTLAEKGRNLIGGLMTGVKERWQTAREWVVSLPGLVFEAMGDVLLTLAEKGRNLIGGLMTGVHERWETAREWVVGLPGRFFGAIGDVLLTLAEKGRNLIAGLMTGVKERWEIAKTWIAGLPGRIATAIGDVSESLLTKGWNLIVSLKNGMNNKINDMIEWVGGIPDRIVSFFGDVGSKLWQKGNDFMSGFVNGIKSRWNSFAGWWNEKVGGKGFSAFGIDVKVPSLPLLYHKGGIVPGVGDVSAILKGGEMVLTQSQQSQLFAMAQGKNKSTLSNPSSRVINFYGDLSFPNITNGDDAEAFIANLEALAGAN